MGILEGFANLPAEVRVRPGRPTLHAFVFFVRMALSVGLVVLAVAGLTGRAMAGRNDLRLVNLCPATQTGRSSVGVSECAWVNRDASGAIVPVANGTGVAFDTDGLSNFRGLMSELGVVMAPKIPMTAETLGFAGFAVSGEIGFTQISHNKAFWNGVDAVSPQSPSTARPDATLTTMGVFLRKGLWFPLPGFEVGGGVVSLLQSQMLSWQGYAKFALHEGYYDLPFPSLAVRAAMSYLTGTDQVDLRTTSLDAIVSKGFGVLQTARLEPFGGLSLLIIKASGKPIDFTPLCDAREAATGSTAGCAASNDFLATAPFPAQEAITRYRFFGGAKLKFGLLAVIGQYEFYPGGTSRDEKSAVDRSAGQSSFSLSTGLDF
jgi:hypothetical protein